MSNLESYKHSLYFFCAYSAFIQYYDECLRKQKKIFNKRQLVFAMKMAQFYKKRFLLEKKSLGFIDGLRFMTYPNNFQGFGTENGRFTNGHGEEIRSIEQIQKCFNLTQKWIDAFPDKTNAHNYESCVWARALADPLHPKYFNGKPMKLFPEHIMEELTSKNVSILAA